MLNLQSYIKPSAGKKRQTTKISVHTNSTCICHSETQPNCGHYSKSRLERDPFTGQFVEVTSHNFEEKAHTAYET
jgi:hypothetical protein